jgi:hypothetical protein
MFPARELRYCPKPTIFNSSAFARKVTGAILQPAHCCFAKLYFNCTGVVVQVDVSASVIFTV